MFSQTLPLLQQNAITESDAIQVIKKEASERWFNCGHFEVVRQGVSYEHLCCSRPKLKLVVTSDFLATYKVYVCFSCASYQVGDEEVPQDLLALKHMQTLRQLFPDKWPEYQKYKRDYYASGRVIFYLPSFEVFIAGNAPNLVSGKGDYYDNDACEE